MPLSVARPLRDLGRAARGKAQPLRSPTDGNHALVTIKSCLYAIHACVHADKAAWAGPWSMQLYDCTVYDDGAFGTGLAACCAVLLSNIAKYVPLTRGTPCPTQVTLPRTCTL